MDDDSSRLITVSCEDHHEALISGLWNFFGSGHRVDLNFQGKDRSIRAHQLIVDVFVGPEKLDQGVLNEKYMRKTGDQGPSTLDCLLEFLYTGKTAVQEEQMKNLLDVANRLEFILLVDAIESISGIKKGKGILTKSKKPIRKASNRPLVLHIGTDARREDTESLGRRNAKKQAAMATEGTDDDPDFVLEKVTEMSADSKNGDPNFVPDSEDSTGGGAELADVSEAPVARPKRNRRTKREMEDGPKLSCSRCSFQTAHRAALRVHRCEPDPSAPDVWCQQCGKAHQIQERCILQCGHCDFKTNKNKYFQLHLAKHDPSIKIYRCDSCKVRRFLSLEALERHKVTHAGLPEIFKCTHCERTFRSQKSHDMHQAKHDPSVIIYKCDRCTKKCLSQAVLDRHKMVHTGLNTTYKCHIPDCNFSTDHRRLMYNHMFEVHRLDSKGRAKEVMKCPECEFVCSSPSVLKIHVLIKHSGMKPYKCSECNYSSNQKSCVTRHFKLKHLLLKPFLCDTCGYAAMTRDSLARHRRRHTGETPFVCKICSRAFRSPTSLKVHVLRHEGPIERTFVCHLCGSAYCNRNNLQRHLRRAHGQLTAAKNDK